MIDTTELVQSANPEAVVDIPTLKKAVEGDVGYFVKQQEIRFGGASDNPQVFHTVDHLWALMERSRRIYAGIMEIAEDIRSATQREAIICQVAAAGHDSIQAYGISDEGTIKEKRIRHRGLNERASVSEAGAVMGHTNAEYQRVGQVGVYTDKEIEMVEDAVWGTIPDFSLELGTVTQPNNQGLITRMQVVIGLSDLGGAGMDGPEQFIKEGNSEFQEVNTGIDRVLKQALASPAGLSSIQGQDRAFISREIAKWLIVSQPLFIKGRYSLLDQDLGLLNDQALSQEENDRVKQGLKKGLFNRFEESIAVTGQRRDEVWGMLPALSSDAKTVPDVREMKLLDAMKVLGPLKFDQVDDQSFNKLVTMIGYPQPQKES